MHFTLNTAGTPDLATIAMALRGLDPAMACDMAPDGHAIRIATAATWRELLECLQEAGVPAGDDDLLQLPSQCCGGCGG